MSTSNIRPHGEPEKPCASGANGQRDARPRDNPVRLQRILDSIKDYAIITLDCNGCVASWNRGAERLLGYTEDEVLGASGDIFFTPEDRRSGAPERERRIADEEGRATNERWHVRKDGSRFWGSGLMLRVSEGEPDAYLKIFRDNTEVRRAAERQALLIDELNHRVKNTLAIVQSMAMQTLRSCPSTADARDALESRLVSLAKAHDILTSGQWRGGDLAELVTGALEAYSNDSRTQRFDIHGAPVRLRPKALLALSMAVHELATNAVKYGALSNDSGKVEISWDLSDELPRKFRFRWKERGGPSVQAPRKRGFGSRLVEEGLAQDITAEVHLCFAGEGLECTIEGDVDLHGFLGLEETVRPGYQQIRVAFKVTGDFDDDQLAELAQLTSYSPVRDTVSNPVPVAIDVSRA